MRSRLLPLLVFSALGLSTFIAPATARAAQAMCSNQFGQCTVSNDNNIDFESCNCVDNSTTGGTGGNSLAGLTQAELMEICEDLLLDCDGAMAGDTGTDTGDSGTDTSGDDTVGTFSTTGDGDGDGDGDPTDTDNSTDTGDSGPSETSGVESTSGDGDGDPDTTSTGTGTDTDEPGGTDAGESTGTTTSGVDDSGSGSGCGCTVNHAPGVGFFALWIIGLIGINRRERAE